MMTCKNCLVLELQFEFRLKISMAEGIEAREDFEWLKQNGYQLFQGYLFGKPSIEPIRKIG